MSACRSCPLLTPPFPASCAPSELTSTPNTQQMSLPEVASPPQPAHPRGRAVRLTPAARPALGSTPRPPLPGWGGPSPVHSPGWDHCSAQPVATLNRHPAWPPGPDPTAGSGSWEVLLPTCGGTRAGGNPGTGTLRSVQHCPSCCTPCPGALVYTSTPAAGSPVHTTDPPARVPAERHMGRMPPPRLIPTRRGSSRPKLLSNCSLCNAHKDSSRVLTPREPTPMAEPPVEPTAPPQQPNRVLSGRLRKHLPSQGLFLFKKTERGAGPPGLRADELPGLTLPGPSGPSGSRRLCRLPPEAILGVFFGSTLRSRFQEDEHPHACRSPLDAFPHGHRGEGPAVGGRAPGAFKARLAKKHLEVRRAAAGCRSLCSPCRAPAACPGGLGSPVLTRAGRRGSIPASVQVHGPHSLTGDRGPRGHRSALEQAGP